DGIDLAFGSDEFRQLHGVKPAAGPEVRNDIAGFDVQGRHQLGDFFFLLAFRPFEPAGALVAHDLSDLAAQIEFAGAVRIVLLAGFVASRLCWLLGLVLSREKTRGEYEQCAENKCGESHGALPWKQTPG